MPSPLTLFECSVSNISRRLREQRSMVMTAVAAANVASDTKDGEGLTTGKTTLVALRAHSSY